MSYDVIMWDVDGTIIDSEHLYNDAIRYASTQCGAPIDHISDDDLCGLHMQAVWALVQESHDISCNDISCNYETWLTLLEDFYIANQMKLRPIDDSAELIRFFHAQGIEQVCVSNSSRKIIDINLAYLGLGAEFKFIVSVDDVEQGKPDPEPYLRALSQFEGKKVIAVEDSMTGLRAAQAANIPVVKYQQATEDVPCVIQHLDELKGLVL